MLGKQSSAFVMFKLLQSATCSLTEIYIAIFISFYVLLLQRHSRSSSSFSYSYSPLPQFSYFNNIFIMMNKCTVWYIPLLFALVNEYMCIHLVICCKRIFNVVGDVYEAINMHDTL